MNKNEIKRLLKKEYTLHQRPDKEDLFYIKEAEKELINNKAYEAIAKEQLERGFAYLLRRFEPKKGVLTLTKETEFIGKWYKKMSDYKDTCNKLTYSVSQGFLFVNNNMENIPERLLKKLCSRNITFSDEIYDEEIQSNFYSYFAKECQKEFAKKDIASVFSIIPSKPRIHIYTSFDVSMCFSVYYQPYWVKDRKAG